MLLAFGGRAGRRGARNEIFGPTTALFHHHLRPDTRASNAAAAAAAAQAGARDSPSRLRLCLARVCPASRAEPAAVTPGGRARVKLAMRNVSQAPGVPASWHTICIIQSFCLHARARKHQRATERPLASPKGATRPPAQPKAPHRRAASLARRCMTNLAQAAAVAALMRADI